MSAWQFWTTDIASRLSEALGVTISANEIVTPPDATMGEFSFACFRYAKERKQNPAELARELVGKLTKEHSDLAEILAVGPYVNFRLATGEAVARVVRDIETKKEMYGASTVGENKELLFEYAQPNTHKEVHVGHFRNLVMGVALISVLKHTGWKVVPMSYHGDVGAHVAKCLWWVVASTGKTVSALTKADAEAILSGFIPAQKTGKYLGEMYAESSRALAERPEAKEEVSLVQQRLESHDPAWEILWRETRRWSLDDLNRDFSELGVQIARQYLESEVVDRGQQMVDHLLSQGIAKESQGAIVVDLEAQKLGVFLVRKSDGTSLYATKDLALAEKKIQEYPKADRSLILVDNRQRFYFNQLFATLEKMEIRPVPEFLGYEFVTLKSGAMSSREGNVVTYQSFRDAVVEYARSEVVARHPDWSEGKVAHTAWALAMGGMKFGMLKQDGDKIFTFDLEESLAFDGATGPYCQYAATRLASILRKAGSEVSTIGTLEPRYTHATEKALALALAAFPRVLDQTSSELRPAVLAQWCHETAQRMNDFYRDVPVLESEGQEREARLRLVVAARQVLGQGLGLLGIPLPDEM
jgi:arginyl-tRNA synthetase